MGLPHARAAWGAVGRAESNPGLPGSLCFFGVASLSLLGLNVQVVLGREQVPHAEVFFFSCFLSEQRADDHKKLKPVPGGLCVISFAWPCPLDVKATNTKLLMCMRRERDGISGPTATLSFSPGAAHQTCRQAARRVPVWHRGKEEIWCWRGHRDQRWLSGPGRAEGFGICSAAGLYRNTIPCCQSRGMRLVRFCLEGLCCPSPDSAGRSAQLGIRSSFWSPPRVG